MSHWRTFKAAAWLGWQVHSNWTNPLFFLGLVLARPLSTMAIVMAMYGVVTGGQYGTPAFAALFIGQAFYPWVEYIAGGMAWGVLQDREQYRTLKFIATAPLSLPVFLCGRAAAWLGIASVSTLVLLLAGPPLMGLAIGIATLQPGLLALALVIGLTMLLGLGLLLAGMSLRVARHGGPIGEGIAGGLYLFSGAIFPLASLPEALRLIGQVLPISWWIEVLKRAFLGWPAGAAPLWSSFPGLGTPELVLGAGCWALVLAVAGWLGFRAMARSARELGLIDWVSNY